MSKTKSETTKMPTTKVDQRGTLDKGGRSATHSNGDDLHRYVPSTPHDVPAGGTPPAQPVPGKS